MNHKEQNYSHLIGNLEGLNADMVEEHLGLYVGYVKKYNEINAAMASVEASGNYSHAPHSELVRRRSVAWNGTRLHELYFEALINGGKEMPKRLREPMIEHFGSVESWEKDLRCCASATPGWVILGEHAEGRLEHFVVYEHQNNYPAEVRALLTLDCWEHAFAKQYGTNKGAYLDAFLGNVDWEVVASRRAS